MVDAEKVGSRTVDTTGLGSGTDDDAKERGIVVAGTEELKSMSLSSAHNSIIFFYSLGLIIILYSYRYKQKMLTV